MCPGGVPTTEASSSEAKWELSKEETCSVLATFNSKYESLNDK